MIKAIVYYQIEEKEALEKQLMAAIPEEKSASASKALMSVFSNSGKKRLVRKSRNQTIKNDDWRRDQAISY
ncbi:MAG: hypothetical protein ABJA70_16720 [Chryseolinea sp.]